MFDRLKQYEEGYPHVSNTVLLLFCGYVITWYLQLGYRIPVLGAIRFEFIYAAVLTVVALLFTPKPKWDCPVLKWVVFLLLAMVIQIPFSYNVEHSWQVFVDRVVKFSFMGFFIVRFVQSPKGLILFIGAFLLACFKMGLEGFIGQITGNMVWENQGIMRLHGSTPLYAHPNSFAGMAIGVVPFVFCLFGVSNSFIKKVFFALMLLSITIIICTGSRTAYVAFFVFSIVYTFKNYKLTGVMFLIVSFFVLYLISSGQYKSRLSTIITGIDVEGNSIGARKEIISDAIEIFFENPFGVGVSAFPYARSEKFGRSQDTHNLYLEVATNLGVPGIIAFIGFITSIYVCLFNAKKSLLELGRKTNAKKLMVKLIERSIEAILYFLIIRLTLGMFGMDLYEIYWWFIGGLVVSIANMVSSKEIYKEVPM